MIRLTLMLALSLALPTYAFDLQGHRGARGLSPENTMAGWVKALEIGVNTIECDLGMTQDGVLVVHHDLALNPDITRGPDGQWLQQVGPLISRLSLAELQTYDVGRIKPGTKYAADFSAQEPVDGTRIPRLAELFALLKTPGSTQVAVNCETKLSPLEPDATASPEAFARAVIAETRKAGMADRMTIQSFDWRSLQAVQQEAPEIRTAYLSSPRTLRLGDNGQPSPWLAGFSPEKHGSVPKAIAAAKGRIWSPNHAFLTPELLAEAKALGLQVIPWTVNDQATINKLLNMGVDGIISDRPDLVLLEQNKRVPQQHPVTQHR